MINTKLNDKKHLCNNNKSSSFDIMIKGMITDLYLETTNSSNKVVDFDLNDKLHFTSTMGHRASLNSHCYVSQQPITSNLYAYNKAILDSNKVVLDKMKSRKDKVTEKNKQIMNQTAVTRLSEDEYAALSARNSKLTNVHNNEPLSVSVMQQRANLAESARQQQQFSKKKIKPTKEFVVYDTLFVGNLHASLQENDLLQVFQPFGDIVECCKRWIHFGFVKFSSEDDAAYAFLKLNGFIVKGRPMRLEFQKGDKHFSNDTIFQYKSRNTNIKTIELNDRSSKVDQSSNKTGCTNKSLFLNLLNSKSSIINSNYCNSNESLLIDKEKLLRFAYGYFTENEQKLQNSNLNDTNTKEWLDLDTLSKMKQNKTLAMKLVLSDTDKSLSSSVQSSSSSSSASSSSYMTKSSTSNCKSSSWLFDERQLIELNESNNRPLSQYMNIIEKQTNVFDNNDDDGANSCFSNTSDDASTIPTDIDLQYFDHDGMDELILNNCKCLKSTIRKDDNLLHGSMTNNRNIYKTFIRSNNQFVSQSQEYHLFPDM